MKQTNLSDVAEAVSALQQWRSDDRGEWIKIGQSIHAFDDTETGLELWISFSERSESFKPGECEKKWRGFKSSGPITEGTLFYAARLDGWRRNGDYVPPPPPDRPKPKPQPITQITTDLSEIEALPLACGDPVAQDWLLEEYGLPSMPNTWRLKDDGIVYQGTTPSGITQYKWKSMNRNEKGKRFTKFLHAPKIDDDGPAAIMLHRDNAPLVITGGEEKAALAHSVGYAAFSSLNGESRLHTQWVSRICDLNPPSIIVAMDNDSAGNSATQGTMDALKAAGYPAFKIHSVQWDENRPQGYDINDLAKDFGPDVVIEAITNAKPLVKLPVVKNALDFVTTKRPPLEYHIDGILPKGGKMNFSATAKFGKSMFAIECGLALAAGDCQWLGWKFGVPSRVLYLQAELMDALLEDRLEWILNYMPTEMNRDRAMQNFFLQEISESRPNIYKPEGKIQVESLLHYYQPNVMILDPLIALCPGIDENAGDQMSVMLDYFTELTRRFGVAIILIHHHGKGGVSRGHSSFEGWPETDLSASFVDPDDRSVGKIEAKLRCSHNHGPAYWRQPSKENPWFDLMPKDYSPSQNKRSGMSKSDNKRHTTSMIPVIMRDMDSIGASMTSLCNAIQDAARCSRRTAEQLVADATAEGLIIKKEKLYELPE